MHSTRLPILKRSGNPALAGPLLLLLFLSCQVEVPTEVYENPLDQDLETPALVFFPDSISAKIGESISVQVFAMEVANLGGARIQLRYDKNKLSFSNANAGEFFLQGAETLFLQNGDGATGTVDIHAALLGPNGLAVQDTANLSLAYVVFTADVPGKSTLSYEEEECELVDPDDNPIVINGFGEGIIHAQ